MPFPFPTHAHTQHFRHGGRTVLITEATLPAGDTPAARHLRALALRLLDLAVRTHLPDAATALEQAAAIGALHAFFPYRYAVNLQKSLMGSSPCLTLSATLLQGNTCLCHHALATYWTPDLALQRLPKHTFSGLPKPPRNARPFL